MKHSCDSAACWLALMFCFWVFSFNPALAAPADSSDDAAETSKFLPPALYEEPLPTVDSATGIRYSNDVVGLRDITYKTVTGYRPLKLDLYVPRDTHTRHPAVIWIHGGGMELGNPRTDWTYGDWTQVLAELAGRGYVVAGITYRFSGEAIFPAAVLDVKDAIRFVRKNADLYGVDPDRLVAWGLSAGGYFSAMVGTTCQVDDFNAESSDPDISCCVQAVVDWFGPTDFNLGNIDAKSDAVLKFLGCDPCAEELRAQASPVTYVTDNAPPFLIMQGGADPLVVPEQSQRLHELLKAHGVESQLIVYPGLGHGFNGATEDQLREILETTFTYIDQQMHTTRH